MGILTNTLDTVSRDAMIRSFDLKCMQIITIGACRDEKQWI